MGIGEVIRRAVFLDRDGVLNEAIVRNGKPYPPSSVDDMIIVSDAFESLSALKNAGFLLIGCTNQPDVARGTTSYEAVEAIHAALLRALPLDNIRVCYHDDADQCDCRKPLPGLLLQAAQDFKIDLAKSFMIGDRWKDISAGQNAGCQTIWIDQQYDEQKPAAPDFVAGSLKEAVKWVIDINPPQSPFFKGGS
ncbi:MAG: HAD family hydrolase [Gammaproteobacteria bacterium]|nr:HAD family hydrolase [Gammaproteobacteria bacterium]